MTHTRTSRTVVQMANTHRYVVMAILIGTGIKEDEVKNMVTVPALLAPSFNSLPSVLAAVNQQLAKYWQPAAEPPCRHACIRMICIRIIDPDAMCTVQCHL